MGIVPLPICPLGAQTRLSLALGLLSVSLRLEESSETRGTGTGSSARLLRLAPSFCSLCR